MVDYNLFCHCVDCLFYLTFFVGSFFFSFVQLSFIVQLYEMVFKRVTCLVRDVWILLPKGRVSF